jgi:hypothetical protein
MFGLAEVAKDVPVNVGVVEVAVGATMALVFTEAATDITVSFGPAEVVGFVAVAVGMAEVERLLLLPTEELEAVTELQFKSRSPEATGVIMVTTDIIEDDGRVPSVPFSDETSSDNCKSVTLGDVSALFAFSEASEDFVFMELPALLKLLVVLLVLGLPSLVGLPSLSGLLSLFGLPSLIVLEELKDTESSELFRSPNLKPTVESITTSLPNCAYRVSVRWIYGNKS